MTTENNVDILKRLTLIHARIKVWDGSKTIDRKEVFKKFPDMAEKFPSTDFSSSIGDIYLYPKKKLSKMKNLRGELGREIEKYSVKFNEGRAVDEDMPDELIKSIERIFSEFDHERSIIDKEYDDVLEEHIKTYIHNPKQKVNGSNATTEADKFWREYLRREAKTKQYVLSRCSYKFSYSGIYTKHNDKVGLKNNLEDDVKGLSGQLFDELAAMADIGSKTFIGNEKVSQKAIRTFVNIRKKADALSLLDNRIIPIIDLIDITLAKMPKTGYIEGPQFMELFGLIKMLSDAEQMKLHGTIEVRKNTLDNTVINGSEHEEESDLNIWSELEEVQHNNVNRNSFF